MAALTGICVEDLPKNFVEQLRAEETKWFSVGATLVLTPEDSLGRMRAHYFALRTTEEKAAFLEEWQEKQNVLDAERQEKQRLQDAERAQGALQQEALRLRAASEELYRLQGRAA